MNLAGGAAMTPKGNGGGAPEGIDGPPAGDCGRERQRSNYQTLLDVVNEGPPAPASPAARFGRRPVGSPPAPVLEPWSLRILFRIHRWRILLTYALFNLENLLRLAQPWVLGLAVNDLLQSSYAGLALFAVQHVAYVLLSAWRQTYDTRTFSRISTDLATRLVLEQRRRQVEVSRVAARSALSREIVDFFEHALPFVVGLLYSVVGALVMLAVYDWVLVPTALVLLIPLVVLSYMFGRTALRLNRGLHDELEREVEVIGRGNPEEIHGHYARVKRWQIRRTDRAALNFCLMEVFAFGLMAAALIRCCTRGAVDAGQIFAVFGYILIFSSNLTHVPMLIEQVSRLRDIARRMRGGAFSGPLPAPAASAACGQAAG
jgi:ABC-type multidrug transport system fused ATPase/permease subunit